MEANLNCPSGTEIHKRAYHHTIAESDAYNNSFNFIVCSAEYKEGLGALILAQLIFALRRVIPCRVKTVPNVELVLRVS